MVVSEKSMSDLGEESLELDELSRFQKSLQELKSLRPQLHYAADYCEASLRETAQKTQRKKALENAKEYIGKAVVTTIDHLGSVSANLESLLCLSLGEISGVELRIDCLKQRLLTCEQYCQREGLAKQWWNMPLTNRHRRYVVAGKVARSNEDVGTKATLPLASSCSIGFEFSALLPKIENQPVLVKSGSTTSLRSHPQTWEQGIEMFEDQPKKSGESRRHRKLLVLPWK
ncbi:ABIL1 protein [Nymphaea thermarum]|nr:ABIL1 protein [Nymphaea thermarum]